MTIRCKGCREFFNIKLQFCPECGEERYAFNVHLRKSGLNSHLYDYAENGTARSTVSARQAASEYVKDVIS